jgi:EAL domain-containing protein (putative c-di-GMP-specific phosphodiesterase class I)
VASIIDLSHALSMTVVAEGVEVQSQLEELIDLGCDLAQGFHLGAAGTPAVLEEHVRGVDTHARTG